MIAISMNNSGGKWEIEIDYKIIWMSRIVRSKSVSPYVFDFDVESTVHVQRACTTE